MQHLAASFTRARDLRIQVICRRWLSTPGRICADSTWL